MDRRIFVISIVKQHRAIDWMLHAPISEKILPALLQEWQHRHNPEWMGPSRGFGPIAQFLVPGLISFGYLTNKGVRNDSSYINRLSNQPCSPK